jgi:asparagine synthase (glutamine-hydrolysing)
MSGIAGFLDFGMEWKVNKIDVLRRMADIIKHRGPDMSGTFEKGPCYLAHRRLSIIDMSSAGKQPLLNKNGTVCMVYAGRTYNYKELRNRFRLHEKGYVFRSTSDGEVLLHLYEELGIDFLKQLNGIFSIAVWDARSRTLYCARDPYGFAPLFYMQQPKCFWFGSEIKAVLQSPTYTPEPELEALYHFFGYDYVPGTLTPFRGIKELPPGRVLKISMNKQEPEIARFFDISYNIDRKITEKEAITRSQELVIQAVKRQLIADVPVGVMLSGGMDSSTLSSFYAKIRGNSDFHTFALTFDDVTFDESPYSQLVSKSLGTKHHERKVTAEKVKQYLYKHLVYIDEPYADGAAIPTFLLSETAKDYVSVLLSGEGGDEFFAGYVLYSAYKIRSLYRALVPGFIRKGIIRPLVHLLPVSYDKLSFDFKAKRFTHGCELSLPHSHYKWREVLSKEVRFQIFSQLERFSEFPESQQFFIDTFNNADAEDTLNKLMYIEFNNQLPNDLMIKNERMTMAHSIEARVPFTDNDLVQFLSTMPVNYKMKGMRKKHLMRSAMEGLLPEEILKKKKVGMEMPYSKWFCAELREFTDEVISEKKLNSTGLFNGKEVRRLWDEHQNMKVDHGRFFWGLLSYMLWYDMYIDKRNFAEYLSPPREPRR